MGKYDVEVEYLDEQGNVWDSSMRLMTDSYDEAYEFAMGIELSNDKEQVAIWLWDEDGDFVEESLVVKEFGTKVG